MKMFYAVLAIYFTAVSYTHLDVYKRQPKHALSHAKYHILASLVKGEVLSPEKIRATTGAVSYTHLRRTPPVYP